MMKKVLVIAGIVAGLLCSCQPQSESQQQETEGAKIELWNMSDSISSLKRLQKWEAYVEKHPKDEMGWRNLYDAKTRHMIWHKPKDYDYERKEFMQQVENAIPNTYTYYLLAMETAIESTKIKKYAEEAMKRLPEQPLKEDYEIWCCYLCDKDQKRLKDMLTRYYESGLMSPDILYYHYNEMQGMEEGGIYYAQTEQEIVPKKMIQLVFGMHRDKILVNENDDWAHIWKLCGVPFPDENWAETVQMDTDNPSIYFATRALMMVDWIAEHSQRPVYISSFDSWINSKRYASKLPKEMLKNLYNEGLLLRYSSEPYDNIAATCRNVEERYQLDYLYLPFSPLRDNEHYWSDATDCAYRTIVLLQGILPHYQKYNPQRCHWLSGLLLKTIDRWRKVYNRESLSSLESEIRPYFEATTSTAP